MDIAKRASFIVGFLAATTLLNAAVKNPSPYDGIRYHEAFDQEKIYKKYENLLVTLGCYQNVFDTPDQEKIVIKNYNNFFKDSENPLTLNIEQFQKDCLDQLRYARFIALAEPGMESGMYITFGALAALVTMYYMGKNSAGGSYSGYSAIFGAAYELNGLGKSLYNLVFLPNNSLESLENYFAKNKCFIPRILWPKIINAFIDARQTDALKEKSINFLKFTLGFTTYKNFNHILSKTEEDILNIKHEINKKIDTHFQGYQTLNKAESLMHIKINISKFIDCLVNKKNKIPRYIYLHGVGGIGKTHFVQTLASWLEQFLPGLVYYQDLIVNSITELEGDSQTPGAFLKVLRNQTMENKIGSIVMIDEATWLNDTPMISAAKRIFNGDRTKLSTAYFGLDIDGSAVTLDMPPMLIFVASNDQITDPALASRFDIINYPIPTKEALIEYAHKIIQSSVILEEQSSTMSYDDIVAWIESIEPQNLNFRYIAGNIEAYVLSEKHYI